MAGHVHIHVREVAVSLSGSQQRVQPVFVRTIGALVFSDPCVHYSESGEINQQICQCPLVTDSESNAHR